MKKTVMLGLLLLTACGAPPPAAPPLKWHDADVRIETEPSPPRIGKNETRIVISMKHGRAVRGVMVSARTSENDPWQQAFPDGDLGIYHTAIDVGPGREVVEVLIDRDSDHEKTTLKFPLKMN